MPDFDHAQCKNPIRRVKVFGRYITLQKATTWWNSTEVDGIEKLSYVAVTKIKKDSQEATQIIFFKYLLNITKI